MNGTKLMLERLASPCHRVRMLGIAASLACAVLASDVAIAETRSDPAGTDVPAMVRRTVPATVSVTTRQIEHDQFNRSVATRGLGSGFIVDRRGFI